MAKRGSVTDIAKWAAERSGLSDVSGTLAAAAQACDAGALKDFALIYTTSEGEVEYTYGWTDGEPTTEHRLVMLGVLKLMEDQLANDIRD